MGLLIVNSITDLALKQTRPFWAEIALPTRRGQL
jgi:hypothetical protein